MNRLFILIILGLFVVVVNCRPSQAELDNESQEELECEDESVSTAEDNADDSQFGDEDSNSQDLDQSRRLLELNRNNYLQKNLAEDQVPRTNLDTPDYKPTRSRDVRNDKFVNNNDEFQSYNKRRRYIENNDGNVQAEIAQHLSNHEINNFKSNRLHNEMLIDGPINKNKVESRKAQTEEADLLFENNRDQTNKVERNDFNEPVVTHRRSSFPKQYYNQMQSDEAMLDNNKRDSDFLYYNRERREIKKSGQGEAERVSTVDSEKESLQKSSNENEEMAIKKHIRKMSTDELEQLLNSLSEDKRALLKKIMDDDISENIFDNINKREITKKAGAVEDNSFIDGGRSESSKLQDGLSAIDITTAYPTTNGFEATTNKQQENQAETTVISNKASPESNCQNKAELNGNPSISENMLTSETDPNKNSAEIVQNEQILSKTDSKRETNTEVLVESLGNSKVESEGTKEFQSDNRYFFPQDEDLTQFLDDVEQSRTYDSSKIYKREADNQSELESKLKSLEESFPNSDAYDESGPYAYSGPLIRVKRKTTDQVMKKRSAAVLPDAKIGYYPSRSDSSDEDSDEGNEFDDDGFYDPTPNLVNNESQNFASNTDKTENNVKCMLNAKYQSKALINDGTINFGSDTDNVISGVEGVNENIMYNSALRNRRKTDGNVMKRIDGNSLIQPDQSKVSNAEINYNKEINIPNYQDNDSFGGYPRSYEGDLGRYKRVRRVKQSHVPEGPPIA